MREQERIMRAQKEEYERQREELLKLQSQVGGGGGGQQQQQQQQPRGAASAAAVAVRDDSSSLMEDTAMLLQAVNPAPSDGRAVLSRSGASGGGSAQSSLHKTPPRCETSVATAPAAAVAAFVQPSPTVNTKEAFRLAQGMWREESVREEAPQPPQPRNPAFPIYSDENSANPPPPSASKAPFAVFQDVKGTDTASKRRRPKLQPRSEVDKENAVPSCDDDAAKENAPPPEAAPPSSARQTAGVLQPATNVPFVPLEVQEAVLDEDERRQELAMAADESEVGREM